MSKFIGFLVVVVCMILSGCMFQEYIPYSLDRSSYGSDEAYSITIFDEDVEPFTVVLDREHPDSYLSKWEEPKISVPGNLTKGNAKNHVTKKYVSGTQHDYQVHMESIGASCIISITKLEPNGPKNPVEVHNIEWK